MVVVKHCGTVPKGHGFRAKISQDTLAQTRGNRAVLLSALKMPFSLLIQASQQSAPSDHTRIY